MVVGRNPVYEALRDGVPAVTLYVQQYIDNDERVRDALKLAGERGNINLMEAPRPELDRMTNGLNHQGLVLQSRRTSTRTRRTSPPPRTTTTRTR